MNGQAKKHTTPTGILQHWTIHITPLSTESRQNFIALRPGLIPAVCSGQVVVDNQDRFDAGTAMMTSLLMGFDIQSMSCRTASGSVYQLTGRGDIQYQGIPTDYSEAVGQAILKNQGILPSEEQK